MNITIKTTSELDLMRQAGKILADTLKLIEQNIYVGQTSAQLDKLAYDYIISQGAKPSFLGYEAEVKGKLVYFGTEQGIKDAK